MKEEEIRLVEESWAHVLPVSDAAMGLFYDRLFTMDPKVAALFSGKDMAAQRLHLASALDLVVAQLRVPDVLVQTLRDLGARHAGYGVLETDFDKVGAALLATLEIGSGLRWTAAHADAWSAAWQIVVAHVVDGYQRQRAA